MTLQEFKLEFPSYFSPLIDIVYDQAIRSSGTCGKNRRSYRLGAAVHLGGTLVGMGNNNYRTHPFLAKYTKFPVQHAESAAIIHAGLWNCRGADICVLRVRRDGSIANARPCHVCQNIMKDIGISKVSFSTDNGVGHVCFNS